MTMTAAAYNSLRQASNAESLSYGELALIEEAFAAIPDEKLRDRRENATATDMLDEIASTIGDGREVFVTDDMIIPSCDLCEGPQYAEGDDWNGDTGSHRSCEAQRTIGDRIRAWDERVEDGGAPDEDARKPFDGGIMLAVATVLERWETGDLAEAVRGLAQTAEAVIEGHDPDEDEGPMTYEVEVQS